MHAPMILKFKSSKLAAYPQEVVTPPSIITRSIHGHVVALSQKFTLKERHTQAHTHKQAREEEFRREYLLSGKKGPHPRIEHILCDYTETTSSVV